MRMQRRGPWPTMCVSACVYEGVWGKLYRVFFGGYTSMRKKRRLSLTL